MLALRVSNVTALKCNKKSNAGLCAFLSKVLHSNFHQSASCSSLLSSNVPGGNQRCQQLRSLSRSRKSKTFCIKNAHKSYCLPCTSTSDRTVFTQALDKKKEKPFPEIPPEKAEVDRGGKTFEKNSETFAKNVQMYQQAVDITLMGGGERSIERHVKRHGKMMITDRIKSLVDDMDEFLELSLIAGIGMEYGNVPRGNFMTGIGKVRGRYCMITANDGSFKGGSIYPISLKKQLRAQEIALQNRLPCIMCVDSAGAFLPLQADIFIMGGQGFYNEAVMSAAKIPQVAIVCGSCTAGGAYIPTMADEAIIVHKMGTIFLAGPPLVQAALGEIVPAEQLGGATVHCGTSGCTDYFAENEPQAYEMGRDIVASFNTKCSEELDFPEYDEPLYDAEDIAGIIPPARAHHELNMLQVIARLVDGSRFHEFKTMFGPSLLTGFAHIKGHLVGIIANQGEIKEPEGAKGAHFVQMCSERGVPLVFLQNTVPDTEEDSENVLPMSIAMKSQARMLAAISCTPVPKLTVIVGNGFGPTHYLMGGRAVNPNFLFAWPNAKVAIMEPSQLTEKIMESNEHETESSSDEDKAEKLEKLNEKIQLQSSAMYGASRIWNDGIILPTETRKVLAQCLSICRAYNKPSEPEYPVLRM